MAAVKWHVLYTSLASQLGLRRTRSWVRLPFDGPCLRTPQCRGPTGKWDIEGVNGMGYPLPAD